MSTSELLRDVRIPQTFNNIEAILKGYRAFQVLDAALGFGLFELLDREPGLKREDIASRLEINGMFIRSFLRSLKDIGLIYDEDDQYYNSEMSQSFLVQRSPFYQGDWIEHDTGGSSRWSDLRAQLQMGKKDFGPFDSFPKKSFIRAIGQRTLRGELQSVTRTIAAWDGFSSARNVLDLGGGHGLYVISLCQLNQELQGVIFDKPHITSETQRFIDEYKMSDRIKTNGGDIGADDIGSGFDIILASHVLYKFRKSMPEFFAKAWQALKPGGVLVTNHWFCEQGCVPLNGLTEMDKSFWSFGHPLCHLDKFYDVLGCCGFKVISSKEIPSTYGITNLQIAVKGEADEVKPKPSTHACCTAH